MNIKECVQPQSFSHPQTLLAKMSSAPDDNTGGGIDYKAQLDEAAKKAHEGATPENGVSSLVEKGVEKGMPPPTLPPRPQCLPRFIHMPLTLTRHAKCLSTCPR